jgi:hypothetical protein
VDLFYPSAGPVFSKEGFFNSHRRLHQLALFVRQNLGQ